MRPREHSQQGAHRDAVLIKFSMQRAVLITVTSSSTSHTVHTQ